MAAFGGAVFTIILFALLMAILIPLLLIGLVVSILRGLFGGGSRRPRRDYAMEELRYRFARGEISEAKFEQGMYDLGYEKVRR